MGLGLVIGTSLAQHNFHFKFDIDFEGVGYKGLGYPTPQPLDPKDRLLFIAPETVATRKVRGVKSGSVNRAHTPQVEFAIELLQFPALTCTKLSLLFFYRRVFCQPWRAFLSALLSTMIILCIIWGFGFFFSMTFICGIHFPAFWTNVKALNSHCSHLHTQQTWLAVSDFVIDAIIFLIPIPLVCERNAETIITVAK